MLSIPGRSLQNRRSALFLAGFLGWSLVTGCSARMGGPGESIKTTFPRDSDCLGAHRSTVRQQQELRGVAGTGRLQFVSDTGRGRASFDFVFLRPDTLRLQFNSPLGPVAAVLDLDRDHYLFADFREGIVVEGAAGEEDLFRLTGLPVDPRMLISLLLAEPLPGEGGVNRLQFDPETCLPLVCELTSPAAPGLPVEVVYRWPGPTPAEAVVAECLHLPDRVVFSGPGSNRSTTIRFRSVRPLTAGQEALALEPIDTSGLQKAMLLDAAEHNLPRWVR